LCRSDGFLARHADTVVGDRHRVRLRISVDRDRKIATPFEKLRFRQRFESELVASIRGVGDELAEKDFLVAVERMDHQLEQLLDLRLKSHRLGRTRLAHCSTASRVGIAIQSRAYWGGAQILQGRQDWLGETQQHCRPGVGRDPGKKRRAPCPPKPGLRPQPERRMRVKRAIGHPPTECETRTDRGRDSGALARGADGWLRRGRRTGRGRCSPVPPAVRGLGQNLWRRTAKWRVTSLAVWVRDGGWHERHRRSYRPTATRIPSLFSLSSSRTTLRSLKCIRCEPTHSGLDPDE